MPIIEVLTCLQSGGLAGTAIWLASQNDQARQLHASSSQPYTHLKPVVELSAHLVSQSSGFKAKISLFPPLSSSTRAIPLTQSGATEWAWHCRIGTQRMAGTPLPIHEGRPSIAAILQDIIDQTKASEVAVHSAGAYQPGTGASCMLLPDLKREA